MHVGRRRTLSTRTASLSALAWCNANKKVQAECSPYLYSQSPIYTAIRVTSELGQDRKDETSRQRKCRGHVILYPTKCRRQTKPWRATYLKVRAYQLDRGCTSRKYEYRNTSVRVVHTAFVAIQEANRQADYCMRQ